MAKKFVFFCGMLFFASPAAFAALNCSNQMEKAARGSDAFRVIDRAAKLHAYFGTLSKKKTGAAFNVVVLQSCANRAGNFQGIAAHFQVRAKAPRQKAEIFTCLTKQKRFVGHDGWSPWFNVETTCREKLAARIPGRGYDEAPSHGEDPAANGTYPSPDELYDPDFYGRRPSYGPDAIDDGSSDSRGHDDGHYDGGNSGAGEFEGR